MEPCSHRNEAPVRDRGSLHMAGCSGREQDGSRVSLMDLNVVRRGVWLFVGEKGGEAGGVQENGSDV